MPAMVTKTPEGTADRGLQKTRSDAPSSWGLGDGAAIPWEYAPAPEARDIVTIKERYGLFIGGKDVAASDGKTFATVNPATEEPLAEVARATAADMDKAVKAARSAFRRSWGTLSGKERAKYLFRIARILQERSREFAVLESMSTCRSRPRTSGTTPAGRTSSTTRSPAASRSRSASRGRSSRGTSRS
jgi:hypothetical protein